MLDFPETIISKEVALFPLVQKTVLHLGTGAQWELDHALRVLAAKGAMSENTQLGNTGPSSDRV